MTKITFMVNVHNEEPRVDYILKPAVKWADEVIIIDKGSTDRTVEIAESYGAKIFQVGESPEGDDDRETWVNFASNDWIYWGTPSEIPTRTCIDACREMANGDYDLITVPRKMYMLGVHSANSPWYISHYRFLFNRTRTIVKNKIHQNFAAKYGKIGHVPYSPECCVYHLTYTSGKYWINTMVDYWQTEAKNSTNPEEDISKCFASIQQHEAKLRAGGEETRLLHLAWTLYHIGTAFFLEEKRRGMDIKSEYKKIYDQILKEWE